VEQQPGQRALSQPQQEQPEQPEQPEQRYRFSGGVCRTSYLRYVDDFALFANRMAGRRPDSIGRAGNRLPSGYVVPKIGLETIRRAPIAPRRPVTPSR
jgi:hypothetical protein